MLGPIEAGIVLESVVKSGTRFILFPNGNGIFPGSGLPRFGEGLIWIADIWSASWEICMQVRKQQLELDMEQQTGSK